MSPARARTSRAEIVTAGRDLLEAGGLDAVTMQAVGARVGVRPPSLYKRFPNRGALVAAIGAATLDDLRVAISASGREADPATGLRAAAAAFRAFAHRHPRAYELSFMNLPPDARPPAELNAQAAAPVLALAARLVGPDRALDAARLITAFTHGFVSMELTGAFRLGGNVDEAFRYGVDALVDALATPRASRRPATGATRDSHA
jgi:AcrR family transcriptional regulator